MSNLPTETVVERLRKATLCRYEHGGGRFYIDGPAGTRELIADFYREDMREFIVDLIRRETR